MSGVLADLGMSLDGFIAGPDARPQDPLGDGGTRLHEWVYGLQAWRERLGLPGADLTPDNRVVEEADERTGA